MRSCKTNEMWHGVPYCFCCVFFSILDIHYGGKKQLESWKQVNNSEKQTVQFTVHFFGLTVFWESESESLTGQYWLTELPQTQIHSLRTDWLTHVDWRQVGQVLQEVMWGKPVFFPPFVFVTCHILLSWGRSTQHTRWRPCRTWWRGRPRWISLWSSGKAGTHLACCADTRTTSKSSSQPAMMPSCPSLKLTPWPDQRI